MSKRDEPVTEILTTLLETGADINLVDAEEKNALMLAIENKERTTIRVLRSKGAVGIAQIADEDEE